jgi:hypothetical protein
MATAKNSTVAALLAATACVLLSALLTAAPAAAACPNEVFRSGPSAKLPDCRAYELVTPAYTGGIKPQGTNFSNMWNGFEFPLMTATGDSVVFNTVGAALSGSPGNGFNDRYIAKRTANGWVTEMFGPTAAETPRPTPGAVSPDHGYSFTNAGLNEFNIEPEATLQAPFGGRVVDLLRKPNGEFELIGVGSLGSSREATGRLITAGGGKIVFTASTQLEPDASPTGLMTVYERTPGGPTEVVSLLPNGTAPSFGAVHYLGHSADGSDIGFRTTGNQVYDFGNERWYVRRDNGVTKEVIRENGLEVGSEVTCTGEGAPTISYQWLRNGAPIGGATDATYTVTGADAGAVLQCQVKAVDSEATSLQTSMPPHVVAPYFGKQPPYLWEEGAKIVTPTKTPFPGFATVGTEVTCKPEAMQGSQWENNPTFSYQWFRDGAAIPGATSAGYEVAPADDGGSIQCRVTASNADGTVVTFSRTLPVHPRLPLVTGERPVLSNVTDPGAAPEAGDELLCSPGDWSESPGFSYEWLRNGVAIGGETAGTYTVGAADEGATLQCGVTAATADTSVYGTSNHLVADPQPSEAPPEPDLSFDPGSIFGNGQVGETMSCYPGSWTGEPTIGFQWLRDGAEIAGANEESYVVTADDLGNSLQCRVTATNAAGSVVWAELEEQYGPRYVIPQIPFARAQVPVGELVFGGIFGGHVFYGDKAGPGTLEPQGPGNLFSFDLDDGTRTVIADTGDALFSHVTRDGSRVYFVSQSEIGGEGNAGEWNLYVWSRADDSTTYIATVEPEDVEVNLNSQGQEGANVASWAYAMAPAKESHQGLADSNTRSTPDGTVFLFQTTAQLTSFNNVEASPEDCIDREASGNRCQVAYLYDAETEDLTCVSCPPQGSGPATGHVSFFVWGPVTSLNPPNNLTDDGSMVVFESTEDLLPQDGNERKDVYRWKKGEGLALISTGQEITDSHLYSVTPSGSDIAFLTTEQLLPQDQNGGTERIYDARVNGGFPPPEETVTEPCSGDACQGNPSAAPEAPGIPSSTLNGTGNVKQKLKCPKGKRRVVRKGKERCIKRKPAKHRRKAGAKRGANR